MILVRAATPDDAETMSAVLIASITELCAEDHRNDPTLIVQWTANKTPEAVRAMFGRSQALFVAECDGEIAAVGLVAGREIALNYVSPAHRFAGVSKALLAAMEAALGPGEAALTSTRTARRFYRDAGWVEISSPTRDAESYPMRKRL